MISIEAKLIQNSILQKTITLLLAYNGTLITVFVILFPERKNLMQQAIHLYPQLIMIYATEGKIWYFIDADLKI